MTSLHHLGTKVHTTSAGNTSRLRALIAPLALASVAALSAGPVAAQAMATQGSYLGLNLGQSRFDAPRGSLHGGDDRDQSAKITYGIGLTPHFSTEVSVFDLGSISRGGGTTKVSGASLSLVGRIPVDRLALFGKVGATYGRTDTTTALLSDVRAGKTTGWSPSVGAGVSYDLTPSTALVAEWERHRLEFAGSGRDAVDATSVGVRWKF